METVVFPSKNEKVRLLRYSSTSDQHSESQCVPASPDGSTIPCTITVSGKIGPSEHDIPSPLKSEKVRLVGFSFTEPLNKSKNSKNMNGNCRESSTIGSFVDPKVDKERQERLARLMEETQDWFSQIRSENHRWRSGMMDSSEGNPSDKMKKFFVEAQEKFKIGNNDLFNQFVQDNQERFVQLLEESGTSSLFNSFPHRPTSMFFDPSPGVCNSSEPFSSPKSQREAFIQTRSCSGPAPDTVHCTTDCSSVLNGDKSGAKCRFASPIQTRTHTTVSHSQSFRSSSSHSFSHQTQVYHHNQKPLENNSEANDSQMGCRPPPFTSFPTFPEFSGPNINLSSPTKVHMGGCKSGAYQMTSSRSTFEYCGDTNTYRLVSKPYCGPSSSCGMLFRSFHFVYSLLSVPICGTIQCDKNPVFSTEQVIQSFEHGYESISESEDEEEESVEDATSIVGEPSECDETSVKDVDARSDSGCMLALEYETKRDKIQQTLHKIASELLTTERTYVSILRLLDQVFAFRVDQENRVHNMFPAEVVCQMFTNLKSLYQLHHDFLLPQLEDRMANWESERRIGDIMKNFAPFLKMYTEYVKNYDNAMRLINLWYSKQSRFAQIMDELHRMEECGHLTLQHHMLTPVQRVPRYQLLLKDYLKKLPEDSPDRPDTEKALDLVSTAATHANEAMKKIDKFKKLLEIQEMIGGVMDLVSPTRELLKEGKIIKISARSGDHQERYLFLFNDLLLLCNQRLIANRVVSGPCFRVRAKLDVEGLVIEEGDNLETANTFYVRNTGRSIELYTQTPEEKQEWMQALAKAVHDLAQRKSSLKVGEQGMGSPGTPDLGRRAPTFIKQENVTHCMSCSTQFSTFAFKRKHHCHACGIVACTKCLSHKLPLLYDGNKVGRVCSQCYEVLSKGLGDKVDLVDESPKENGDNSLRRRGVLDVRPTDPSVLNGYLQLKARSRFWVRRWFALHADFVLYSFQSHGDNMALTSMPVPGYTVALPEKGENVDGREHVFKIFHKKKVYYFQTTDSSELQRWVDALQKASRAESAS